jgi:hypothetical protein
MSPRVTFHAFENARKCEGMNLHIAKWAPTLGVGVPMDFQIFKKRLHGSKFIGLKNSLNHWKVLKTKMSEMSSHDPFGFLKHKLWPKEGPGVKLAVWLPTIKSWKSPWFPYVQVVCHILLERSWQGLRLYFRPYLHWRFAKEVMGLQSCRSPNLGNVAGVLGQNDIWVLAPWWSTKNTIREKVMASPSLGCGESCEPVFTHGSFVHQKCFSHALTSLLFGLCRSVWVIDLLVTLLNPYPRTPTRPSTPEMLRARERTPTLHSSVVFTLNSHLSLLRSLGVC